MIINYEKGRIVTVGIRAWLITFHMYAFNKFTLLKYPICTINHIISKDGVSVDPSKVAAVMDWKQPKSVTEIRIFFGRARYYRRDRKSVV